MVLKLKSHYSDIDFAPALKMSQILKEISSNFKQELHYGQRQTAKYYILKMMCQKFMGMLELWISLALFITTIIKVQLPKELLNKANYF